jgi:uncharacterized protein YebE (UPF0316 family)
MTFQPEAFDWVSWVLIPLLIFLARLLDVSMATVRNILTNRGLRQVAPLIGFFEMLIWLVAITQVMQNLNNVASYLAWALGFAAGNYLGILIEERLALGHQIVRVFADERGSALAQLLREEHFGVTTVNARGSQGPVELIFVVTRRKRLQSLLALLHTHAPNLFFTIEDVRGVDAGFFDSGRSGEPTLSQQGDANLTGTTAKPVASEQANDPESKVS